MHWEVLPHTACSPSDFYLLGPLKEALEGKRFRADDEVKVSVKRWLDEQPKSLFEISIMKLPEGWR
jgi:hypothetical protein